MTKVEVAKELRFPDHPPPMQEPPHHRWPWQDESLLRFDYFMARALHDPGRGYYARRIRGVGRGGDFTTAPMISETLARALAKEILSSGLRNFIEIGPGEGVLTAAILQSMPWWKRWRLRVHLVETSSALRDKQRQRLGRKVLWHDSPASALSACAGEAFLFSNELIDAFPVRRFRKREGGWDELFLEAGEPPRERWIETEKLPDSSIFEIPHPAGQIVEVHESANQWLQTWLPHWKRGRMITIDYGDRAEGLYHRRPMGSLRAYLHQQRLEGSHVYLNPGRQDLTADVNFTDLERWCSPFAGNITLRSQRDFLLPHVRAGHPGDAPLVDPTGAGLAFKVLCMDAISGRASTKS